MNTVLSRPNATVVGAHHWVTGTHIKVLIDLSICIFKATVETLVLTIAAGFFKVPS